MAKSELQTASDLDDAYRNGYEAGYQACRRSKRRVTDDVNFVDEKLTNVDSPKIVNELRGIHDQLVALNDLLLSVAKTQRWL